jgi:hypothetical protein
MEAVSVSVVAVSNEPLLPRISNLVRSYILNIKSTITDMVTGSQTLSESVTYAEAELTQYVLPQCY